MSNTLVYIAADHRGFPAKSKLVMWLKEQHFDVKDLGTHNEERCDAADYAIKMADVLKHDSQAFGILICGTGHAMAMTANRYKSVRAVQCTDSTQARLAREHNDANVLVLGGNIIGLDVAYDCIETFLKSSFLGGRYKERRDKLMALGGLT